MGTRLLHFLVPAVVSGTVHSFGGASVPTWLGSGGYPEASASGWDRLAQVFAANLTGKGPGGPANLPQVVQTKVRTRDGTLLTTMYINPYPYDKRKSVAVCRSPYALLTDSVCSLFVLSNGFAAVMQELRGTFSSTGTFDMFRSASGDGLDTLAWVAAQPWSNGKIYGAGLSADGMAEASLLMTRPPHVRGQWWMLTSGQGHDIVYPRGVYRQNLMETYMEFLGPFTRGASTYNVIPELRRQEAWSMWWYNITLCRRPAPCHYASVDFPVIHTAGWWDVFIDSQLDDWAGMRAHSDPSVRDDHVLVVGPLGHCTLAPDALSRAGLSWHSAESFLVSGSLAVEMFGGDLRGPVRARLGRINLFVMAGFGNPLAHDFWTSLDDWPAFGTRTLYLRGGGSLGRAPATEASSVEYTYDPRDPTPMIGGSFIPFVGSISGHCGTSDQLARERRGDVVVFDSEPLERDLPVVGRLWARLFVRSSQRDTDFVVHVTDLAPGWVGTPIGRSSMLVRYGAVRMRWRDSDTDLSAPLEPDHVYEVNVSLSTVAYIFPKGHRVRVTVSSAAAPLYSTNPNTGHPLNAKDEPVPARNAVHMAPEYPSSVSLPVVDMRDIPENHHFALPSERLTDVLV